MTATVGAEQFRQLCGRFATGVSVVTATAPDGSPAGMTANSFASVSLSPPLVSVNIDHAAEMHRVLEASDRFIVNILRADQEEVSRRFAETHESRFEGVGYERNTAGLPVLRDTLATLECEIVLRVPAGDHTIIVASVTRGTAREGEPLVYHRGEYRTLGAP